MIQLNVIPAYRFSRSTAIAAPTEWRLGAVLWLVDDNNIACTTSEGGFQKADDITEDNASSVLVAAIDSASIRWVSGRHVDD